MTSHPTAPIELSAWACSVLGAGGRGRKLVATAVAGDASNRRYFRAALDGTSYILVEAPPTTEKNAAFLAIRELLAGAGVRVPALYAADIERGYLLLEDLGDRLLLPELDGDSADDYYRRAFDVLSMMVRVPVAGKLPVYDGALLNEELDRFADWFVQKLLGYSPGNDERDLLTALGRKLVDSALEQPRVLVHRDFHSRNLMLPQDGQLAVIDFQDAVLGPISYDPVSLLRDCYIQWPAERVREWALDYRDSLHRSGLLGAHQADHFLRWFDWMGLQRHLKVLGTFARLYLRDGKPAYLDDLPLVISYVREIVDRYAAVEPEFAAFHRWFEHKLSPLVARQDWNRPR